MVAKVTVLYLLVRFECLTFKWVLSCLNNIVEDQENLMMKHIDQMWSKFPRINKCLEM